MQLNPSHARRFRFHDTKKKTTKLCCRKDDRAIRPIGYMDALNFRDSLTTPTAIIPKIFSWSFVPIDPMNVPTKFEVRSFTRS